jgi:multidrug transporter EmrE-like cation transporter
VSAKEKHRVLTWQVIALVIVSVCCSAFAQLALKHGMAQPGVQSALASGGGPAATALAVAGSPGVWIGLFTYGLSALLWLFVLARLDVSVAYAFVALGFLLVMGFGVLVFGEPLTARKVLGTALVAAGIWIVATSTPGTSRAGHAEARSVEMHGAAGGGS